MCMPLEIQFYFSKIRISYTLKNRQNRLKDIFSTYFACLQRASDALYEKSKRCHKIKKHYIPHSRTEKGYGAHLLFKRYRESPWTLSSFCQKKSKQEILRECLGSSAYSKPDSRRHCSPARVTRVPARPLPQWASPAAASFWRRERTSPSERRMP